MLCVSDLPHVEELRWYNDEGKLWVKWKLNSINRVNLTEYVVEWVSVSDGQMDWQREHRHASKAAILGKSFFVCYLLTILMKC